MNEEKKTTVVIGATPNAARVSYGAIIRIQDYGHNVIPLGIRKGEVDGLPIVTEWPEIDHPDTVTLYIGKARQLEHYDYILGMKPRRIVFNPGAENPELFQKAKEAGIRAVNACTLVMLSGGHY